LKIAHYNKYINLLTNLKSPKKYLNIAI